jgi:hypothetical protein
MSYEIRGLIMGLSVGAILFGLVYQNSPWLIGMGMGIGALLGLLWKKIAKK